MPEKTSTSQSKLTYHIQTFGCTMNYSDTERVTSVLHQAGYQPATNLEDLDLFIFNTCSIKQKGEDRVFGMINNIAGYKRANPRLLIGITGCMVRQTSSRNSSSDKKDQLLKILDSLDFVFRITDTHNLIDVLVEAEPQLELSSPGESVVSDYLRITPNYSSKFQASVPIQIGCDKYCTYCIVPYARGREKSRPQADILAECRKLVEQGCKEITLVGQTVNSYGLSSLDKQNPLFQPYFEQLQKFTNGEISTKPTLPFIELLQKIDQFFTLGLSRLRYISPHPRDLEEQLITAHASLKTLCPYIHLPIQSGDNQVLARMNRKYTVEQYREKVQMLKAQVPDMVITTDIIIGFSGETDGQFEHTVELFNEFQWDQVFISRYSERIGTIAAKNFPNDVPKDVKASRWHRLNNLLKQISKQKHQSYEGKIVEVLVEKFNSLTSECEGRSRDMKLVQFPGQPEQVGKILNIRVIKGLDWLLKGEYSSD